MTALKQYERLEAIGLWRESDAAQLREVVVSFGAASLVLSDKNDMPLAHWSLAALYELNSGKTPTVFALNEDAEETLEIDDELMVKAIGEVREALTRKQTHPGRLRWIFGGVVALALGAFVLFGLPVLTADYATRVVPFAKQQQLGTAILAQTNRLTGRPCNAPQGRAALTKMRNWLLGSEYQLHVVDMGARFSTHLPGKHILINRSLIEEYAGPEVAAGFILMELALTQQNPPMANLFHSVGTRATLAFLAQGELNDAGLARFAEAQLSGELSRPPDDKLLVLFAIAGLTSSPFAYALDASLKGTQALVDGDPVKVDYQPHLTDGDWISLQSICGP